MRKNNSTTVLWQTRLLLCLAPLLLIACAKMGQPDGGWYDETPPHIIGSTPSDKAINVKAKKMTIYFDEFINLDNPTENVVVSPPQLETPEIKSTGKKITIQLIDSLKPATTYTIDFSNAISDNNEDNPLGNFTYSFSTSDHIDTMEVSGYVLEAETLEPIKGILVGLYNNLADSAFRHEPMLRVSRTDSRGHFVIKGVAQGKYRIYALQDADGNYTFNQKSEKIAFNHNIIEPSWKPDIRQDTLWRDSLHIDSIVRVPYTHFLPDNIVLRAFTETQTDRYYLKAERTEPDRFRLFFSYGHEQLPELRGLNFNDKDAFVVESTEKNDTITYWLRDTTLINQDTLRVEMKYWATDTTGVLVFNTDTLDILAKTSYEKRMKQKQKDYETWKKKQEKAEKRGEKFETEMPVEMLKPDYKVPSQLDPDKNILITMPVPINPPDTAAIHLYSTHDSLWYNAPFIFREKKGVARTYELLGEWRPEVEYSLEIDSAAFRDIYGHVSAAFKQGFKIHSNDDYSSLLFTFIGMEGQPIIAQLLDKSGRITKEVSTETGMAEFFYVKPETYFVRMFIDKNRNGLWDTGEYDADMQPEEVYYYPEEIECKQKWDVSRSWDPRSKPLEQQKPAALVKQKAERQKTIKNRNAERARKLGIEYIRKY